jgi:hypothetical protein
MSFRSRDENARSMLEDAMREGKFMTSKTLISVTVLEPKLQITRSSESCNCKFSNISDGIKNYNLVSFMTCSRPREALMDCINISLTLTAYGPFKALYGTSNPSFMGSTIFTGASTFNSPRHCLQICSWTESTFFLADGSAEIPVQKCRFQTIGLEF